MCPPTPVPPVDIALYWTDEEVCMSLEKHARGSPLPRNVFADINPYQHIPSNLPEGIWYFIRSEDQKNTECGFWKSKGGACVIFSNSTVTGWRTTLEYHEGQTPSERKTEWVMQEYTITQKGLCGNSKLKETGSLCRVFLSEGSSSNHEKSAAQKGDETSGQGSVSESQVNKRDNSSKLLAVAEAFQNFPDENLGENDLRGDYLELDDLATPLSPLSSSDNSSCLSMSSDECFDALALLQDLDDEANQQLQGNKANSNLSVCASVKPNEVVMYPPSSGPVVNGGLSNKSASESLKAEYSLPDSATEGKVGTFQKQVMKSQNSELESALKFHDGASSSRTKKTVSKDKKKGTVGRMKSLKRKYLCFMPF